MMTARPTRAMPVQPLDIAERLHAFLPEPIPNRAEALEGLDLASWLNAVVASDQSGFTVLAGRGTTFVLLYAAGIPMGASLSDTTAALHGSAAIQALVERGPFNMFALTYCCEPPIALALSSLFGADGPRSRLDADPRALAVWLAAANGERASGALLVDAGDDAWSVLLLADGVMVAGYGSDDRSFKAGIDDASILLLRDDVWVTRLSPQTDDLSEAFAEALAVAGNADPLLDAMLRDVETALIGALGRLEHLLTRASESDNRLMLVVDAFRDILTDLDAIPFPPDATNLSQVGLAPLSVDGLTIRFEERMADYVDWLANADAASARVLHGAADELVRLARALTGSAVRLRG